MNDCDYSSNYWGNSNELGYLLPHYLLNLLFLKLISDNLARYSDPHFLEYSGRI